MTITEVYSNPIETIFNYSETLARYQRIREPLHILKNETTGQLGILLHEEYQNIYSSLAQHPVSHIGILPSLYPEWLGNPTFLAAHGVRFPYIVGEMANGIATAKMVVAAAQAGCLGFFGAAGLMPAVVETNLLAIKNQLPDGSFNWGANLIHSPQEPHLEEAIVNLYLQYGVSRISASAYMSLTPPIIQFMCHGLRINSQGAIERRHYIVAKISRPEIAKLFMSPPPNEILDHLVSTGKITAEEAHLAAYLPVATDITVEADSGGHTDNRPLVSLMPVILQQAKQLSEQYGYSVPFRIGAAGGLGTPSAIAAAFALGADYVLTGSINQSAVESGLSWEGKKLLAQAEIADVAMAAAADMFELGVKLQVLKRGTLFAGKANKLYEIYKTHESLSSIGETERQKLEIHIFKANMAEIWEKTQQFFAERDPQQLIRAQQDPKHQMALVFRWYLGLSSRWAIQGIQERLSDFQIWCGPAMGAFNAWVKNSFLESLENRTVAQIARNLLEGAAVITRAQQLRSFGMPITQDFFNFEPRELS